MDKLDKIFDVLYTKNCTVCSEEFKTKTKIKNICSRECKLEHNRQHAKYYNRRKRLKGKIYLPCIVCGFSETSDLHSENGQKYVLCPNHHCLITRGIKTLNELLTGIPEERKYTFNK